MVTIVGAIAILYLGREVFLPLAVAVLLTFALAPIASYLRRLSLPKIPSVILTVVLAFMAIALFSAVVATQVTSLAQNIPTYQNNILVKIHALRDMGANGGLLDRLTGAVKRVGAEIEKGTSSETAAKAEREPLPVEVVSRLGPIETLKNVIIPLISPFATAGLIVVVVIFMLLEREDLRDRFIRLAGYGDLHRTTQALQDAGERVGRYLLMQLVINTLYAIPITIGLFFLGIPNALLWGVLTLVLRFVPYIGPAIGMVLPLFLALAVAPGWSLVLWTAGLFLLMELISNNVLEPWLYGSRTGLSPLAIIVAAIFWAWLWGPLGLILSTPLTVCLVVLGRHVPQFEFLEVLFGNEPVLEPHAGLYQRLLAGDPDEATDNAEDFLREKYLVEFYDQIGIPALLLAARDTRRGVMDEAQCVKFTANAQALVTNLKEIADEEENEGDDADEAEREGRANSRTLPPDAPEIDLPDGEGRVVLCVGGRSGIDDAAAAMLGQVLEVQGAEVTVLSSTAVDQRAIASVQLGATDTVVISVLNNEQIAHARHIVRRLKRMKRGLRVGLFMPGGADATFKAEDFNADFMGRTVADVVTGALSDMHAAAPVYRPRLLASRRSFRKRHVGSATSVSAAP